MIRAKHQNQGVSPRYHPPFDSRLVRAAARVLRPRAVVPAGPIQDFHSEELLYLARYWQVAPTLWLRLRKCPGLPAVFLNELRDEHWRNTRANGRLRHAANELFAALNARDVVPMLLKGGCQLFDPPGGHAGTRFMSDLDLLVPPGRDRLSFETLCQRGFVPAEAPWDMEAMHHWPKLTRPEDGLVVEIHKTPWIGGGRAEAEAFFASSVPIANTAGNARLPCASHRVLHNAIHAFDGLYLDVSLWADYGLDKVIACTNLRQLLDLVELCVFRANELDWGWVLAEADRFDHTSDLRQWSYLARELCGAPMPDDLPRWSVDRPKLPMFQARVRYLAGALLDKMGALETARRWKTRLFSHDGSTCLHSTASSHLSKGHGPVPATSPR